MIKSFELEKEYNSFFDKINKSNVKFTSLFIESYFVDDINSSLFNINFSQIKNLCVTCDKKWFGYFGFIFPFENLSKK